MGAATTARAQCVAEHLFASDGAPGDYFGYSVAIDGDTAIVSAVTDDTWAGSAYSFVRSGGVWTEQAHLFASDRAADDLFGYSVAISGDTVVLGADRDDTSAGANAGSAYVFVRNGGIWTQQAHLFASDGAAQDIFGISVAISGDTVVVGATFDDTPAGTDAGSAYVFDLGCACQPCDTNCDGSINLFDIQSFMDQLSGANGCSPCAGDASGDGSINLFDIQGFVECLSG